MEMGTRLRANNPKYDRFGYWDYCLIVKNYASTIWMAHSGLSGFSGLFYNILSSKMTKLSKEKVIFGIKHPYIENFISESPVKVDNEIMSLFYENWDILDIIKCNITNPCIRNSQRLFRLAFSTRISTNHTNDTNQCY